MILIQTQHAFEPQRRTYIQVDIFDVLDDILYMTYSRLFRRFSCHAI